MCCRKKRIYILFVIGFVVLIFREIRKHKKCNTQDCGGYFSHPKKDYINHLENDVNHFKENHRNAKGTYFELSLSTKASVRGEFLYGRYIPHKTNFSINLHTSSRKKSTQRPVDYGPEQDEEVRHPNHPKDLSEKPDMAQEFKRRQHVVERICKKFKIQSDYSTGERKNPSKEGMYVDHVISSNFYLLRSASTMTCLLHKVASTSLAVTLLKSDGRTVPEWNESLSPHNVVAALRPENEREFQFARKYFFKFLLVRHPFERLLSAYRDKVERANHWSLKNFRKNILETLGVARGTVSIQKNHINDIHGKIQKDSNGIYLSEKDSLNVNSHRQLKTISEGPRLNKYHGELDKSPDNKKTNSKIHLDVDSGGHYINPLISNVNYVVPRSNIYFRNKHLGKIPHLKQVDDQKKSDFESRKVPPGIQVNRPEEENQERGHQMPGVHPGNNSSDSSHVPSFADFLNYILIVNSSAESFSSHWSTYWENCSPCSISYDVIARLESAGTELKMVKQRLGLKKGSAIDDWYNKSLASQSSKKDILSLYYSQLDPALIGKIYRKYKIDFLLFEYDIMDVFMLGGHCVTPFCSEMRVYL